MINERPIPGWLASPAAGRLLLIGIVAVSVLSLGVAFVGEHAFGIQPCILCLYQRIPYIVQGYRI
jgi:disulfide bond formation protein DsbB